MDERLINANDLMEKAQHAKDIARQDGELLVVGLGYVVCAPTVDAVRVVRCLDCKHWANGLMLGRPCHKTGAYPMRAGDFCSHGERKDGAE